MLVSNNMTKKNIIVSITLFLKDIDASGFCVWVQLRLEKGPLYGLLEFPGGKIEDDESPEDAARREVLEEVGVEIPSNSPVILFKHQDYSSDSKNLCLFVFLSNFNQIPAEKGEWLRLTYEKKSEAFLGKIPPINHVILDDLAVYLQSQFNAGMIGSLWLT